jgi:AraC-like DNA-binding protein
VEEADSYTNSVAGVTVDAIRVGNGKGPTRVTGVPGERLTISSSAIGFPMLTHAQIPAETVVATFMDDAGGGSRWCGVPLRSGSVMVYGPGVEHVGVNLPGMSFTFVVTDIENLLELGERLGMRFELPLPGAVHRYRSGSAASSLGLELNAYVAAASKRDRLDRNDDGVLAAFANLLAAGDPDRSVGPGRGIDSRDIVRSCLEHVDVTERIPSIAELCLASHVSERRLRAAFVEEFDQPPTRYFRAWALNEARRRLRGTTRRERTVAAVASDLGFHHLGRFAGSYHEIFGESPSATLLAPALAS